MGPGAAAAFLGGLIAGSFACAVAYRVPRGLSVVGPRSMCPSCGAQIAAYDNVPVFSWLLLRGRSRCCGQPIAPSYPVAELAAAVLFAVTTVVLWHDPAQLAMGLVFVATLVAITITDLERRIIPNRILLVSAVIGVVLAAGLDPSSLSERAIAAASAGGLLLLAVFAYPRGMGMGDVKLAAVMGLYLGAAVAPALLIGFAVGAVVGIAMIVRDGASARKRAIPFGPFLALGGVIALLAGNAMVHWYLSTFVNG
jgi:leader peptidase (prepilin peptidase)/N-methyltransferase